MSKSTLAAMIALAASGVDVSGCKIGRSQDKPVRKRANKKKKAARKRAKQSRRKNR